MRKAVEAVGARLLFLPPYSPDFNPSENAFAKLEALLRKAATRAIGERWAVIGRSLDAFTPAECGKYVAVAVTIQSDRTPADRRRATRF